MIGQFPATINAARLKLEICILAGGLSSRFGRDKARLRFGRRTMLSIVRDTSSALGVPVQVVRRDCIERCGPLGGVLTALNITQANAVLFLACDMPLVTTALLKRAIRASRGGARPVFVQQRARVGFPFVLPCRADIDVRRQIAKKEFSVQALASVLKARVVHVAANDEQLFNVNTVEDAQTAAGLLSQSARSRS